MVDRSELTVTVPRRFRAVAVDPLSPFTLLFTEIFPYADGELNSVSSGLWTLLSGGAINIVSNRVDNTTGFSTSYRALSHIFNKNVSFAVRLTFQENTDFNITNNGAAVVGVGANDMGIRYNRPDPTLNDYTISRTIDGVTTVIKSYTGDNAEHVVIATFTLDGLGAYDTAFYYDGGLITTVDGVSSADSSPTVPTLAAGALSSPPNNTDNVSYYTIP
jgi:hypothetical protein